MICQCGCVDSIGLQRKTQQGGDRSPGLEVSLFYFLTRPGSQHLSVFPQRAAPIRGTANAAVKLIQINFGLGAVGIAAPLLQCACKQLRRLAFIILKIRADIHTGAAADA